MSTRTLDTGTPDVLATVADRVAAITLQEALRLDLVNFVVPGDTLDAPTRDHRAAVQAFVGKREPVFQGR